MSCSCGPGTYAAPLPPPVSGTACLGAQDAMGMVRHYGRTDMFCTVTCNPEWPEIKRELLPHQTVTDRPDIVCRIFHLKLTQIMDDIIKLGVFGAVQVGNRT